MKNKLVRFALGVLLVWSVAGLGAAMEQTHELRCGTVAIWPFPVCCTVEQSTGQTVDCVPYFGSPIGE